jgi:hypothetical protein
MRLEERVCTIDQRECPKCGARLKSVYRLICASRDASLASNARSLALRLLSRSDSLCSRTVNAWSTSRWSIELVVSQDRTRLSRLADADPPFGSRP